VKFKIVTKGCLIIVGLFTVLTAQGAVERISAGLKKSNQYIKYGTITGGQAGSRAYTLLDLRRVYAPKDKVERLILDLGNEKGKPLVNQISYFHISVEKNAPRVLIELPQMLGSNVDQKKIQQILKKSPYVKSSKIFFDPVDTTVSIQLNLKKNISVEAFKLPSADRASRIIVDLKDTKGT
jgi:hypothetical protein